MTPEEIAAQIDAKSREALRAMNITPTDNLLRLLNQSGMDGFKLGSNTALSMVKGALTVQLMKIESHTREN